MGSKSECPMRQMKVSNGHLEFDRRKAGRTYDVQVPETARAFDVTP